MQVHTNITRTLELTQEELAWLHALTQNAAYTGESKKDADIRKVFFDASAPVIYATKD